MIGKFYQILISGILEILNSKIFGNKYLYFKIGKAVLKNLRIKHTNYIQSLPIFLSINKKKFL
jgi:hypothetical protein